MQSYDKIAILLIFSPFFCLLTIRHNSVLRVLAVREVTNREH